MEIYEVPEIYSRVVWQDELGHNQLRVVINTFREVEYFHVRRYYLDFDEEWKPSNEGVTIQLDIDSTREMFAAMAEIISLAESKEIIEEYFGDLIKQIYNNS